MNKAELVDALAEHFGGNKAEATRALNAVLQTIIFKTATEGRITILGFGTFEKTVRPPRIVSDPATGKKIRIKTLSTPVFRAGAEFKAYVSGAKKVPRRRRTPPTRLTAAPTRPQVPRHVTRPRRRRPWRRPRPRRPRPTRTPINPTPANTTPANTTPANTTPANTTPTKPIAADALRPVLPQRLRRDRRSWTAVMTSARSQDLAHLAVLVDRGQPR